MMAPDRLKELIDAYGADAKRWPADERADALLSLASSAEARSYLRNAAALDRLLDQWPLQPTVTLDPATMAAEIARTPVRRPATGNRRRSAAWLGFGWPNLAALAAAGIVGFMIGWTDLSNATTAPNRDLLDVMAPVSAMDDSVW